MTILLADTGNAVAPAIRKVSARAVNATLKRPVKTAVGTIPSAPLVLIDVVTNEGVTGSAYIFGYKPVMLGALTRFLADLEEVLVGMSAAPAQCAQELEHFFRLVGRQGIVGMVLSGIDMALWDALGKTQGRPVVELLGGVARPVPAYDSYGVVDPVEDRKDLERSLEQGFRAIKIKIGDGDLARDVEMVSGVRDIIGPDIALMIDYNQSRTAQETLHRLESLEEFDLHWVEEPVFAEDFAGHARIREASTVPVQTGENWWFAGDMSKAIDADACDYAMPDLMKIGGVTGWLKAMGLGEAASMPISSHLFVEASAHVLPVTPGAHWLEYLDIAGAVLAHPNQIEDGCFTARGPGLGIVWDEVAVARLSV